jgi:hypothetical protein
MHTFIEKVCFKKYFKSISVLFLKFLIFSFIFYQIIIQKRIDREQNKPLLPEESNSSGK